MYIKFVIGRRHKQFLGIRSFLRVPGKGWCALSGVHNFQFDLFIKSIQPGDFFVHRKGRVGAQLVRLVDCFRNRHIVVPSS